VPTIRLPSLRDRPSHRGPYWLPVVAFLGVAGRPAHAAVADEIHFTHNGQTAITFDWRAGSDSLFYGLSTSYGSLVLASPPSVMPFSSPGPFREAKLTGLTENTLYHYRIGAEGADHTFHTPLPRGASGFRFAVQADVGSAKDFTRVGPIQSMVVTAAPNFVFMIGDLTYANSVDITSVDAHFNDMMVWSQDIAYQPEWGNHEYENPDVDNLANYKGRFDLANAQTSPNAPVGGCCGEDWYWFDYGCVRFIGIPEPYLGAWTDWASKVVPIMDAAQADPAIKFIVTFGHRPAYSTGYHPGETSLQSKIATLAAGHSKFVLNLAGHSHDYERTYKQSGVVHVTSGTGGSPLEAASGDCKWPGGCPQPVWDANRAMHHVLVYFDVASDHITGTVLCGPADATRNDVTCSMGSVFDSFTIPEPDRAPVVSAPTVDSGAEGSQLTLNVKAADPNSDAIQSLTADQLPPGAVFTPAADKLSGTLTWVPPAGSAGTHVVFFHASNALQGTAGTVLFVSSTNQAPTAGLTVSPLTGNAPLSVTADASGSNDPEGAMSYYQFNFGDGSVVDTQGGATAQHLFGIGGEYDVSVTATDGGGLTGATTQHVTVAVVPPGPNLTSNPSFESSSSGWAPYNGPTMSLVTGGFDGSQACSITAGSASGSFGVNDSPNWVATTSAAGARYRISAWVRSAAATGEAKLRITEYQGATKIGSTVFSNPVTLGPSWKQLSLDFITGASGSTLDLQIVDFPVTTGETFVVDNVSIRDLSGIAVGVGDDPGAVLEARSWVTPMPVTSQGQLRFVTPRTGAVSVEIFDASGRRIATPVNGPLEAGLHQLPLGGTALRLRAGLYLYRIRLDRGTMQGRFVVAR
jgi:hypothetical protein